MKKQKRNRLIMVDTNFRIHRAIYILKNRVVMLDFELALLFRIKTRALNQAVKRHKELFSDNSVIVLSRKDIRNLMSQIVTSSLGHNSEVVRRFAPYRHGGPRKITYAFTKHGIMLLANIFRPHRIQNAVQRIIKVWQAHSRITSDDIVF